MNKRTTPLTAHLGKHKINPRPLISHQSPQNHILDRIFCPFLNLNDAILFITIDFSLTLSNLPSQRYSIEMGELHE